MMNGVIAAIAALAVVMVMTPWSWAGVVPGGHGFPTFGGPSGGIALPTPDLGHGWTAFGSWQDLEQDFEGFNLGLTYGWKQPGGYTGWEVGGTFSTIENGASDDGFTLHGKWLFASPTAENPYHLFLAFGGIFSDIGNLEWTGLYVVGSVPTRRHERSPTLSGGIMWDKVEIGAFDEDEFNVFGGLHVPLGSGPETWLVVEWKSASAGFDSLFTAGVGHRFSESFGAQAGFSNALGPTHLGQNDSGLFLKSAWYFGSN